VEEEIGHIGRGDYRNIKVREGREKVRKNLRKNVKTSHRMATNCEERK